MTYAKNVIAVWNKGGRGKSWTVIELANLIVGNYSDHEILFPVNIKYPIDKEFRLVINVRGVIIGFESVGDPNTNLHERLNELIQKYKCDLIVCSTRTSGSTVQAVHSISSNYEYNEIWTSTYVNNPNTDKDRLKVLNKLKAEHILDLIHKLNIL